MKDKHFLDTSVLRPVLTSPLKVKEYYRESLSGDIYICDYIKMEFLRGYIKNCIDFYLILNMPQYSSFSDALAMWSQKFQIREQKNIITMMSNLLEHNDCINDKEKTAIILADYIRRLIGKLNYCFKNIGIDNTKCNKASIKLKYDPKNTQDSFRNYLDDFKKSECNVNNFIFKNHKKSISKLINTVIKNEYGNRDGFDKIIKILNEMPDDKTITCAKCSKIGDMIISLLPPGDFQLEHTDNSFNYFCKVLNKQHRQHPNDGKILSDQL